MKILTAGLLIAYVLLAPLALWHGDRGYSPWVLVLLPLALTLMAWQRRSMWILGLALTLSVLTLWLWQHGNPKLLLFLPPMLIHGFLAYLFGSTLRAGHEPLIVRFIRIVHGPEHPPTELMVGYARTVTLLWALLFSSLLLIETALFALVVPEGLLAQLGLVWSTSPLQAGHFAFVAHGLSWFAMAALMVLEWQVRKQRFHNMPYTNFVDFIKRVIEHSPRLVKEWRHG
ncbi:hypothetical protein C7S18_22555 [Ahniella affigens]|uniref:Xanthomonadin biosynthesis protein n=1 Tax=Ahniella affigens TaxID=2021234 RepID=A0A2P1PY83_9GAMM|nr:hypothetical protein [Ahniella affigens]AVP99783.1 hypothetical protein C7S18_22555 [Ahniella affigens]